MIRCVGILERSILCY